MVDFWKDWGKITDEGYEFFPAILKNITQAQQIRQDIPQK